MSSTANEFLDRDANHRVSRLIGSIRASDDVASTNMLSRLWDAQLPEDADTFHDDLRGASGIGRRKKKKVCLS